MRTSGAFIIGLPCGTGKAVCIEQSSCCDFGPSSGKSRRVEEVPESPGPELTILSASVLSPLMNSRIDKIPKITQKHVRFDIPEDSSSTKVKETERVTGKRFSLGELKLSLVVN